MLSILPPDMSDSSDDISSSDQSESDHLIARPRPQQDEMDSSSSMTENQKGKTVEPPRGVSGTHWEKFLELKKGREAIPSSSTTEVLQKNRKRKRKRNRKKKDNVEECCRKKEVGQLSGSSLPIGPQLPGQSSRHLGPLPGQPPGQEWKDVKQYLGVYDRFKGVDYGKVSEMSGLEKEINSAIKTKDFQTAENLSDRLSNRDFGTKIHEAIKAKEYVEIKEKEKMEKSKKKKKQKLAWRFEVKERWEMKGNM
ncbi:uncharacterized protein [Antedon mediterranea]|uniref:uncharacterized protein n=1 Tax=Antedon mediterranea TaxID=105859 RepID=UPI003AF4218C